MDPVLATIIIALIDNLGAAATLLKQHQSGQAVTPEQLHSLAQQTNDLMAQATALLPPKP